MHDDGPPPARTPCRTVRRKSSDRRIRASLGNTRPTWYRAVRQTACRGPCAGGRQGWRVRTGSASGDGIRGLDCGAGCSAGTCACSREGSLYRRILTRYHPTGARAANRGRHSARRPPNGTGTTQEGQTGSCRTAGAGHRRAGVQPTRRKAYRKSVTNGLRRAEAPLLRSRLVPRWSFRQRSLSPDTISSTRCHPALPVPASFDTQVAEAGCRWFPRIRAQGVDNYVEGLG